MALEELKKTLAYEEYLVMYLDEDRNRREVFAYSEEEVRKILNRTNKPYLVFMNVSGTF